MALSELASQFGRQRSRSRVRPENSSRQLSFHSPGAPSGPLLVARGWSVAGGGEGTGSVVESVGAGGATVAGVPDSGPAQAPAPAITTMLSTTPTVVRTSRPRRRRAPAWSIDTTNPPIQAPTRGGWPDVHSTPSAWRIGVPSSVRRIRLVPAARRPGQGLGPGDNADMGDVPEHTDDERRARWEVGPPTDLSLTSRPEIGWAARSWTRFRRGHRPRDVGGRGGDQSGPDARPTDRSRPSAVASGRTAAALRPPVTVRDLRPGSASTAGSPAPSWTARGSAIVARGSTSMNTAFTNKLAGTASSAPSPPRINVQMSRETKLRVHRQSDRVAGHRRRMSCIRR